MTDSHIYNLGSHKTILTRGTFDFSHVCCSVSGNDMSFLHAMNERIDVWIDSMA